MDIPEAKKTIADGFHGFISEGKPSAVAVALAAVAEC